jgi:GNAT superfamily N-acetyltransferase
MFADVALALRIDAAEARLSRSIAVGLPATDGPHSAFAIPMGSGFAVFGKVGSPINKVIGIGIDATVTADELDEIEGAFRVRGEDVRVELSTLARVEVGALLTARGYRLRGFENVLGLDLRAPFASADLAHVAVDLAADGELSPWLEVLVDGFMQPDDSGVPGEAYPRALAEEVTRDFARSSDVQRYVARIDGEPAGSASMRLDGGIAAMCGASTLPARRRRGVQQALLQRRIEDARVAGCDVAVVTTAPGTQSQSNAERRGFRLLYSRALLVLSVGSVDGAAD